MWQPFPSGSAPWRTITLSKGQEVADFAARLSTAEKETLHLCAALRSESVHLGLGFSALGGYRYAELNPKTYDRTNEGCVVGSVREAGYKGTVDLDLVEGETVQSMERRMAHAEIIDRKVHPEAAEPVQHFPKRVVR